MSRQNQIKSYDKREGETAKAYEAFAVYRDMGTVRSIKKLQTAQGRTSCQILRDWNTKYDWQARVADWDADQQYASQQRAMQKRRDEHEKDLEEFRINHLKLAKQCFVTAGHIAQALTRFSERFSLNSNDKNKIEIKNLTEANQAANILRSLQPVDQYWASALAVDKLIQQLQQEADFKKAEDLDD